MRHSRGRTLQARLFAWFLAAILLAIGSSVVAFHVMEPEPEAPGAVVSRAVEGHMLKTWDDPPARDAYLAQLRETTGLDLQLRTDPNVLPARIRRHRMHGVVLEQGSAFIPIFRGNELLGAVEYHSSASSPRRAWHLLLPLLVAFATLGIGARRVAKRLSRPLEDVARAAEKFGAGDLGARVRLTQRKRHFVSDEVRELGTAFDSMADRIERVVLEQRELLAAISHELRSPLARARVALEIASERAPEADRPRLQEIDGALVSVDAILTDLLASARAGLSDLRRKDVEVDALVRRAVAGATPDPVHAASVSIADEAKGLSLSLDEALMTRAISNVISNARAYAGKEAAIDVMVERRGDDLAIAVSDDGPGFPADVLPRAFEPFVRGDSARTPTADNGTGLGLALVRRIVEAHGGRAIAKNREGKDGATAGAEVTLFLPMATSPSGDGSEFAKGARAPL
jgi:signal transduction histidine kinase